jgi:hypothetical protein
MLPLIPSAAAAYLNGFGLFNSIGLFLLGMGFAILIFVALCSGMESSNWGTNYRATEPIRFWIGVAFLFLFYILFSIAGYFVK